MWNIYKDKATGNVGIVTREKRQLFFSYKNIDTGRERSVWVDVDRLEKASSAELDAHTKKANEKSLERRLNRNHKRIEEV
jgi:hypothetical protein